MIVNTLEARLQDLRNQFNELDEQRTEFQRKVETLNKQMQELQNRIGHYTAVLEFESSCEPQGETSSFDAQALEKDELDEPSLRSEPITQDLFTPSTPNVRSPAEMVQEEFQQMTQIEMITKILEEHRGKRYSTEDIVKRIYNTANDSELLKAKNSVASALSRGVKGKNWQGGRGHYYIIEAPQLRQYGADLLSGGNQQEAETANG
jgi:uncharacterized phage infection (PIP) family protein YhgE